MNSKAPCPPVMPDKHGVFERTADGLTYRILTPELAEQACALEVIGFLDEPVIGHGMREYDLPERQRVWERFCQQFSLSCASNGFSVCCCVGQGTEQDPVRVVGCFWLRDFALPPPEDFVQSFDEVPGMRRMLNVLIETDAQYEELRPEIGGKLGVCMDMWMGSVHPEFRRRGIYKQVGCYAIGHLRALKQAGEVSYKYVVSEDTGAYSQAAARSKGMVAVTQSRPYSEIYPVHMAGLPAIHERLIIHEFQL